MAPSVLIYTNFEGRARAEKTLFFVETLQVPKNASFRHFASAKKRKCLKTRRRKFGQVSVFIAVWESSEIQFSQSKKKVDKIFRFFFENPPPPR